MGTALILLAGLHCVVVSLETWMIFWFYGEIEEAKIVHKVEKICKDLAHGPSWSNDSGCSYKALITNLCRCDVRILIL